MIPAALREELKTGDKLSCKITENEKITVSVVKQRFDVFGDDNQQVPLAGDSLETHDLAGHEEGAAFSKNR
jgi:hypothetical protein